MSDCNELIRGMNPNCDAQFKVGGVNKTVYLVPIDNVTFSYDSDGYVVDIAMATVGSVAAQLLKFTGKEDKNNWSTPMTNGENVNTWNHTVNLSLYYNTPTELDTIEKACNATRLVAIMQNNDDTISILGPNKGLRATAGGGKSGVLINDSTAYEITLTGEERTLEKMFRLNSSATLAQNLAYLDALATY